MRKKFIISIILVIFISSFIYNGLASEEREWHVISGGWLSGGNINGSYTAIRVFPPDEGNGIEILKNNELKDFSKKYGNRLIFSLDFISTPVIGKEFEYGEYYLEGEKITAVRFLIEDNRSDYSNCSECVLKIMSQEEKPIRTINLDLKKNITEFTNPFILNSSGLWKINIEFISDNNDSFFVFENISKWRQYDDKNYLTFLLENGSIQNFKNYYEKCIPVLSTSELFGLQQMLLAEKQGEYLKDTATSLNDTANSLENISIQVKDYIVDAESSITALWISAIAAIILVLATIVIGFLLEYLRQKNRKKELISAFYTETLVNLKTINDFLNKKRKMQEFFENESLPFSTTCYTNLLASGLLISEIKNENLSNRIISAYKTIQYYNSSGHMWYQDRFIKLNTDFEYIKKHIKLYIKNID